jgi:Phage integrase, N-terminal SAM-like domain
VRVNPTYSLPPRQGAAHTRPGRPPHHHHPAAGEAAAAFLAQPDLATSTRRSYQQTLGRLEREFGGDQPLATLTADQVSAVVAAAWTGWAPATWNRHLATVRSFFGFCQRRRWLVDDLTADLERRAEPADRTKGRPGALARADALFACDPAPLVDHVRGVDRQAMS